MFDNIKPLWIISLLDEANSAAFTKLIDCQFAAFTENELGLLCDEANKQHKWWGVDYINEISEENIQKLFVKNHGIPACLVPCMPDEANRKFSNAAISIIIYSNSSDVTPAQLQSLVQLIRNLGIRPNFLYHSVIHVDDEVLSAEFVTGSGMGDALILTGDSNYSSSDNPDGYKTLIGGKDSDLDFSRRYLSDIQVIQAVALGYNKFTEKVVSGKSVFLAGGFTLTYEPDEIAAAVVKQHLTHKVFWEFFNNNSEVHWFNPAWKGSSFQGALVQLEAEALYRKATFFYKDDLSDAKKFFSHEVSPWAILSSALVPAYFRKELKSIPEKLVDYSHIIDLRFLSDYRIHLKEVVFSENGLIKNGEKEIKRMLLTVWSESDRESPVGLQQYAYQLKHLQLKLKSEKERLENPEEYKKINSGHHPLQIPSYLKSHYSKFEKELSSSDDADNRSNRIIQKLIKKIQFHPVPLSLFTRSAILGLLLSVLSFSLILLLPDFLINTSWFEKGTGVWIWLISAFLLPVLFGLVKYSILTLLKIKKLKIKFLAWAFFRIQSKLLEETRLALIDTVDKLQNLCIDLETNLSHVMSAEKPQQTHVENVSLVISAPNFQQLMDKVFTQSSRYPQHYFQQSVFQPIDQISDGQTFLENSNDFSFFVPSLGSKKLVELNDKDRSILFKNFFNSQLDGTNEKVYLTFFEKYLLENSDILEFMQMFQRYAVDIIDSGIHSWEDLKFTKAASQVISARSFPSLFQFSMNGETRFVMALADPAHLPLPFKKNIDNGNESITEKVINIVNKENSLSTLKGIVQLVQFFRIEDESNVNVKFN